MTDVHTKEKRSLNMAAIRGKGNKTTELAFATLLRRSKVTGWRRHSRKIPGKPDFAFSNQRVAIFIDGCFWHGCKTCKRIPASNTEFWTLKIEGNKQRDKLVTKRLKKEGWKVLRFWEHQIKKSPHRVIEGTLKNLSA